METEDKIVSKLLMIGAYLAREGNRIVADFGLNQQQFVVLRHIQNNQPLMQKEICSRLMFEKSHVSKVIKKLKKLNLVNVSDSNEDSRITILSVSKKGQDVISEGMQSFKQWNRQWLESLSEAEQLHAELALDKLAQISV